MSYEDDAAEPGLRPVAQRYRLLAGVYDRAPLDFLAHARARRRAIELLRLRAGQIVVDVACGTGANLTMLRERVGDGGRVIGLDYSEGMLDRARVKVRGWSNVALVRLDAAQLSTERLRLAGLLDSGQEIDAALCTLGLSVIPAWDDAYRGMLTAVREGGRVSIMDNGYPPNRGSAGEVVSLRPFWWIACRIARADPIRRPWLRLLNDLEEAVVERFAAGYVGVAAGTVPRSGAAQPTSYVH